MEVSAGIEAGTQEHCFRGRHCAAELISPTIIFHIFEEAGDGSLGSWFEDFQVGITHEQRFVSSLTLVLSRIATFKLLISTLHYIAIHE